MKMAVLLTHAKLTFEVKLFSKNGDMLIVYMFSHNASVAYIYLKLHSLILRSAEQAVPTTLTYYHHHG